MQVTLARDAIAGRADATWSAATPAGQAVLLAGPLELRSLGPTTLTVLDMPDMSLEEVYAALPAEALGTHKAFAMVRVLGPALEYLVSGDAVLVLDADGEHTVVTAADRPESGRIAGLTGVVLLSAGAAAAAADYAAMTWRELLEIVYSRGPRDLIALTRELERRDPDRTVWPRDEIHREATAIVLNFPVAP
jgi:hypothetical protein